MRKSIVAIGSIVICFGFLLSYILTMLTWSVWAWEYMGIDYFWWEFMYNGIWFVIIGGVAILVGFRMKPPKKIEKKEEVVPVTVVEKTCPSCGSRIDVDDRFCPECGEKL